MHHMWWSVEYLREIEETSHIHNNIKAYIWD